MSSFLSCEINDFYNQAGYFQSDGLPLSAAGAARIDRLLNDPDMLGIKSETGRQLKKRLSSSLAFDIRRVTSPKNCIE